VGHEVYVVEQGRGVEVEDWGSVGEEWLVIVRVNEFLVGFDAMPVFVRLVFNHDTAAVDRRNWGNSKITGYWSAGTTSNGRKFDGCGNWICGRSIPINQINKLGFST
jgi:hypothetical protein